MVTVSAAQDTDDADESATLILDPSGSDYDSVTTATVRRGRRRATGNPGEQRD